MAQTTQQLLSGLYSIADQNLGVSSATGVASAAQVSTPHLPPPSVTPSAGSRGDDAGSETSEATPASPEPQKQQQQQPDQPAPSSEERPGILKRIGVALSDPGALLKGLSAGLLRTPGEALGATMDATSDVLTAVGMNKNDANETTVGIARGIPVIGDHYDSVASAMRTRGNTTNSSFADILSARDKLGRYGNNAVNQATANIASLALGTEAVGINIQEHEDRVSGQ